MESRGIFDRGGVMGCARNRACNVRTAEKPVMSTDSRSLAKLGVPSLVRILGLLWLGLPLSGQIWTQLAPAGGPPPARGAHAAILDPATNHMINFGGPHQPDFILGSTQYA